MVELSRHGVDSLLGLSVVIVMIGEGLLSVQVLAERPEAIQIHVGAELQRQTGHHHPRAEPHRLQALRSPEAGQALEVLWVEEYGPRGAVKVLDGVEGPQGHGRIVAVGERRQEDQGVAVATQTLHEGSATLQ